ncbi:MAG: histidinol-phosphatase [Chloroflexi bacterium]|nr:histidinol-phosphatase [Chloroflexota bacterium]
MHGGHSGDFSKHGQDDLEPMLKAAIAFGYTTFGVTAHAPRSADKFFYAEEVEASYTPRDLNADFANYVTEARRLQTAYADQLEILVGAEVEIVPEAGFDTEAAALRVQHNLDYIVGSVHWVNEMPFDTSRSDFDTAVASAGGLEPFLLRYYDLVAQMIERVHPEVVGHLDVPRLYVGDSDAMSSAPVRHKVDDILERVAAGGMLLEVNVSALRKGLTAPYPASWIVERARDASVRFTLSDDSHSVEQVGAHIADGRDYLLTNGVRSVWALRVSGEAQEIALE